MKLKRLLLVAPLVAVACFAMPAVTHADAVKMTAPAAPAIVPPADETAVYAYAAYHWNTPDPGTFAVLEVPQLATKVFAEAYSPQIAVQTVVTHRLVANIWQKEDAATVNALAPDPEQAAPVHSPGQHRGFNGSVNDTGRQKHLGGRAGFEQPVGTFIWGWSPTPV